jgi:hypothetical protein
MTSLKSFCETLAPYLDRTPAALYERQRALVRMGELPDPVRGRGKGLEATPMTVAMLLIAIMETDNLSDTDLRVHQVAKARYRVAMDRGGGRCKLTGKVFFVDALAAILGSRRLAAQVSRITVHRAQSHAQIYFYPKRDPERELEPLPYRPADSEICQFGRGSDFPHRMDVEATLWGNIIEDIELHLRRATLGTAA